MNGVEKSQAEKFREAAKEIEADDNEKRFDERLRRLATQDKNDKEPVNSED